MQYNPVTEVLTLSDKDLTVLHIHEEERTWSLLSASDLLPHVGDARKRISKIDFFEFPSGIKRQEALLYQQLARGVLYMLSDQVITLLGEVASSEAQAFLRSEDTNKT